MISEFFLVTALMECSFYDALYTNVGKTIFDIHPQPSDMECEVYAQRHLS